MKKNISALTAVSFAAAIVLSACGGGGGNGGSSAAAPSTPASSPTTGNVATPQYASTSAQLAVFNTLNQQRQQCGLPAFTENTILDQAAQAHADYQATNGGLITDTEDSSKPGFTGVTYSDRAVKAGFPGLQTTYSGGASAGYYTNATLTETQYGTNIAYAWMSGVYHISVAAWPVTEIGVGWKELTFNGFPQIVSSVSIADLQTLSGNLPLTFPCQGSSGLPYSTGGETPVPPNTSGNFGQPVAIVGNQTDTIVLQSGTMTDTHGTVINLQLLDSANDPNKLLPKFEAVAYPTAPLTANTTYTVSVTGTMNGAAFSRTFSFTTGNIIG